MKNKKYLHILLNFSLSIMLMIYAFAPAYNNTSNTVSSFETSSVARADRIEWIVQYRNGKYYKRLFNYTTGTWIGDWILVG